MPKICSVKGCEKMAKYCGLCSMHYSRLRKHGDLNAERKKRATCKIPGCQELTHGFGYCKKHYGHYKRYGDATYQPVYYMPKTVTKGSTYSSYLSMCQRCNNPNNHNYKNYGGRGIKVCDRWSGIHGYEHFLEDMGEKPTRKTKSGRYEYSLDRIDPDGNYCPENCRWADKHTQSLNRRPIPVEKHKTKGYCYCPKGDFWMAYCCYHGKQYQKRCHTKSEAIKAAASLKAKFLR